MHCLGAKGIYMVTGATYLKQHFFKGPERLELFHDGLLVFAERYGWELQAWAVFSNHYHFVAASPDDAATLRGLIRDFHSGTARELNRMDGVEGRKVMIQFWDSGITFEKSYLAPLNYVMHNPVRHGLVRLSSDYPWCSLGWFESSVSRSFFDTVRSMPIDRVNVYDEFDPEL